MLGHRDGLTADLNSVKVMGAHSGVDCQRLVCGARDMLDHEGWSSVVHVDF